jgi:APA family basic amino acid/polyamine antiporter
MEIMAWIMDGIGFRIRCGCCPVGIAWSEYLNNLLYPAEVMGNEKHEWCHSPFQQSAEVNK